jgi:hypothetical protein
MKEIYRVFIPLLLLSCLIHLFVFFSFFVSKSDESSGGPTRRIIISFEKMNQNLQQDESENIVTKDIKSIDRPPKETVEQKTIPLPDPNLLPDEYIAGEELESSNLVDKSITQVSSGVNVSTEREKIAKQAGGGVVTTDTQHSKQFTTGIKNEDNFLETFGGAYNTLLGYDDETNDSQGEEENGLKSAQENMSSHEAVTLSNEIGNYKLLSDVELESTFVKDPYSEKKGKELKLINIYYEQISKVIYSNWSNPLSPSELKEKTFVKIRLELNDKGYLEEPSLSIQSKFSKLDRSLISAIKSSMNYQFSIPPSYLQKYRYLILTWSSDGSKYELMPFEKETKSKE